MKINSPPWRGLSWAEAGNDNAPASNAAITAATTLVFILAFLPCRARLLRQPDRVELLVQEVRRRDRPTPQPGAVRDDAVPLQRVEVVDLLVEQPLLESAQKPPALLGVHGPRLPRVEVVQHGVLVAAGVF